MTVLFVSLVPPSPFFFTMTLLVATSLWIAFGGYTCLYIIYKTLPRDILFLKRVAHITVKTLWSMWRSETLVTLFMKTAARLPDKTMITMCSETGDVSMTFREALDKSLRICNYFKKEGYNRGDVISVAMENRLDYCCYWLGLSMAGLTPSLVNNNLRLGSLIHTITAVRSRAVIFSQEMSSAISGVRAHLSSDTNFYCADSVNALDGKGVGVTSLHDALISESSEVTTDHYPGHDDTLLYIWTSGTTGLPKAAAMKHSRCLVLVYALYKGLALFPSDVLYSPLPMYHAAAGIMVLGTAMVKGLTVVTRRKFSASQFWRDCHDHNVTGAQYIGEVARYLLATKECKYERNHNIRTMFGNGMRPQVWEHFQKRFQILRICEYYGSTEGNCSITNLTGEKIGAVGFIPFLLRFAFPLYIIKIDEESGEPARGPEGFAVECGPGEAGELVGKIVRWNPVRNFHGYTDKNSTNKKIMRNVFSQGDLYFRSGDLLIKDEYGWMYFKDRSGDTFRWKGENVSTMEVEAILSELLGLRDVVVFGVQIPGTEGRAGMAVIPDPERTVDLAILHSGVIQRLPSYARPVFVRFVKELSSTGTHKFQKALLQKEAFNVEKLTDDVYILDSKSEAYQKIDSEMYNNIINGNLRI